MRLNLGCGPVQPDGWVNVDSDPKWGALVADPLKGLPVLGPTYEVVVAHHVLQMVAWPDLVPWLREVRRATKPGGVLRLSVPDLLGAVGARARGDRDWFPIADEHEQSLDGKLCMYVSQAGATRSVFTPQWLLELLVRAGWQATEWCDYRHTCHGAPTDLDSRPTESIFVEALR